MTKNNTQSLAMGVDPAELMALGKEAARLSNTGGITLSEACVQVMGQRKLAAEQVRRVVETANREMFHQKYASANPADRYINFDVADPSQIVQELSARQQIPGGPAYGVGVGDYFTPPTSKTASVEEVLPVVDRTPRGVVGDIVELQAKLSAALDEVSHEQDAAQWRMDEALARLIQQTKTASLAGATQGEVHRAWAAVDLGVANSVMAKVGKLLHPGDVKVAGRSINQEHPIVTEFATFVKEAKSFLTAQAARQEIENNLIQVEDWLQKQSGAGHVVGHALRGVASGGKKVIKGVVRFGGEVGEAAGGTEGARHAGEILTGAALTAGGVAGATHAKRKFDEWRFRHGLYSGY